MKRENVIFPGHLYEVVANDIRTVSFLSFRLFGRFFGLQIKGHSLLVHCLSPVRPER